MEPTEFAIAGLVAWSLFISVLLVSERSLRVLFHGAPANRFDPHGKDVEGFRYRLVRVHANNFEYLALLLGVPLLAVATNNTALTNSLAEWLLAARIAQSVTHLISVSALAVYFRVTFLTVQLVIIAYWLVGMLSTS